MLERMLHGGRITKEQYAAMMNGTQNLPAELQEQLNRLQVGLMGQFN
jgi:hypothetical protein